MEEQKERDSTVVFKKVKLHEAVAEGSLDFDEWTSLISETEKIYPDNIEKICLVYDSFLSEYPLCYAYWRKYINHKIRLCTIHKVVEAFERAVVSATYSVEVWADYCNFARMVFEDPSDVHRLFRRAISFVGKDYLCHTLWDKYIEFAFSLKHWSSLADIYIQALRFPTKKLHRYNNSFKKLVEIWEEEMESHSKSNMTTSVEPVLDNEVSICYKEDDISCIIKDLLDPSIGSARRKALQKYMSIGEHFYQQASQLNEKINHFETRIKRSYFHVKPVDISQLENWHQYLDFAESHGGFDWAVKLYERCLIPCANYPEFWIRYMEFMESKGGREIAHYALDRATTIFLKRVSVIHLFNARFKEHVGDVFNARAAFLQCDTESDSDFVENVVMRSNMEKRHGNFEAASTIYKEAIEKAATKEKWHILPTLYVHFSQLKYMTSDSEDAARDILIDGIKQLPSCKLLIEELIKFGITHGRSRHVNVIQTIVANAISPGPDVSQGFSPTEREQISRLYVEFVDLCGTILDVRKAWNQHIRLFPESVRASSFCPAMGTKQWKITLEAEEETLVSMPHQPSGDTDSQCLIQSPVQDKKLSPLKNYDTQDAPAADQVSDQKLPLQANHDMLSNEVSHQDVLLLGNSDDLSENNPENVFQAKVDLLQLGEPDNNVHESVHIASPKVSEPIGTDVLEPNLSLDFKNQVANVTESTPASLEFSEDNNVRKEHGNEPEPDLKLPSLEGLSLNIRDAKSPGPISPTACDSGATDRTILLDGNVLKSDAPKNIMEKENISESGQNAGDHIISSPVSTQATASAQTNTGHVSPTFSASNQKSMADTLLQPQKLANNGKNWHQRSGSDRFHRDSKFGFRGHSHKRMHKQLQSSPQRMHPRAEKDMIRDHPSQPQFSQNLQVQQGGQLQSQNPASAVQTNQTAPQAWQMNNLQQQNLSHTFQFQPLVHPTTNPQLQMSQHPIQSNEQQGNVQNNQAYDQMWQYYYYQQQQQQLLWQQQQMLQHQQPQQQQMLQHQQPQQQQMLQHQQSQQQQLLQQQYQQQVLQMQYFQQQQLQMQQQQPHQMQQQPYQQQHLLYLQQQQQLQLQQPQHQQSLQQQKHHLQQQTASSQQHPHEQEQGQPMRQTNTLQEPDTDTIESSASPRPVSPKLMT